MGETLFTIIVLIFSVVIHEVMHGAVADKLGDPTARLAGRLTLNPLKHIDPFGSVILPAIMALLPGGTVFGWAKPVPFNPYNLKNPERDSALIAIAGSLSNLGIAVIFSGLLKIAAVFGGIYPFFSTAPELGIRVILVNVTLAIFNLVPLPPLDGSKVLFAFLDRENAVRLFLEKYGMFVLLAFIFWGFDLVSPIIRRIFLLLVS